MLSVSLVALGQWGYSIELTYLVVWSCVHDDDRVWRKICAGGWDEKDTRVACRIL